jgi:hypothetical protein
MSPLLPSLSEASTSSMIDKRFSSLVLYITFCLIVFFPRRTDVILLALGFVGLACALLKQDNSLFYNTFLLFFLPVLFSPMGKIDERFFFNTVVLFFSLSTMYLLGENIVLHPARFGLSFKALNYEQLCYYTDFLVSSPDYNAFLFFCLYHAGLQQQSSLLS